jgi:acid phosphatase (class A)
MNARKASSILVLIAIASLAADKSPLQFLKPDSIDVVALLPAPPKADSKERQAEIQEVLDVQATRSAGEIERAKSEEKLSVFAFKDVLGDSFTAQTCPKTEALFKTIGVDSKYFSDLAKAQFKVARPFGADARVQPLFQLESNDFSYPSGHATRGMLFALILAEVFPDRHEDLIARGHQIGWDRVIAGVHYESDLVAGRVLGKVTFRQLMASEAFKSQLEEVKAELVSVIHEPVGAGAAK